MTNPNDAKAVRTKLCHYTVTTCIGQTTRVRLHY